MVSKFCSLKIVYVVFYLFLFDESMLFLFNIKQNSFHSPNFLHKICAMITKFSTKYCYRKKWKIAL